MTFKTVSLTFRQKALLIRAIEEQVTDLRSKARNSGLTKEHLDEHETLLDLITHGQAFQVEPTGPEKTTSAWKGEVPLPGAHQPQGRSTSIMTMTAYEIATKAARMARRSYDFSIDDIAPDDAAILVADEDGIRGLVVNAKISGSPILADGHRQVTLPEDEAVWTAARWIDGAELPVKDKKDENDE